MFDKRIMEKQYTDEFVYGGACCMDGIKDIAIRDVNAPTYVGEAIDKLKILESNWEMGLLHIAEIPNGTPIFVWQQNEDEEWFVHTEAYLYGVTEYFYGELGKDVFTSKEECEKHR